MEQGKSEKKETKAEAKKEDGDAKKEEKKAAPPVKFGPRNQNGVERSREIIGHAYDAVTKDLGYDYNRPWKTKNPYYVEPEEPKEKKFCKAPKAEGKEGKEGEEGKEGKKEEKKEAKKEEKKEEKKEGKEGKEGKESKKGNSTAASDESECIPLPAATNATDGDAKKEEGKAEAAPAELLAKKNDFIKAPNATNITLK